MNNLDYIISELTKDGWDEDYGELLSKDMRFKAQIAYNTVTESYEIRVALLVLFDRWANSGEELCISDPHDVVNWFKNKQYIPLAYEEVLEIVKDELRSDDKKEVMMVENFMNEIIEQAEKRFERKYYGT